MNTSIQQRNLYVSLNKKAKGRHYTNLEKEDVTDCKIIWGTVKLFIFK